MVLAEDFENLIASIIDTHKDFFYLEIYLLKDEVKEINNSYQ